MLKYICALVFLISFTVILFDCSKTEPLLVLEKNLLINTSSTIKPAIYEIDAYDSLDQAIITVEGEHLLIDFNGAVLNGAKAGTLPNQFTGLGVKIQNARHVTIRNLTIKGFQVGLLAENVDSLTIEDCDFSFNFRQKLLSTQKKEDLSDWLSYHNNEADEWLRYGAGIYLKNCDHAMVKRVKIIEGQNGLMLSNCDDGTFYNNTFQFNSGVGIGLYRSSKNSVMHNKLDWNVRGYSHDVYQRGQDSAGILCYEQSNNNVFSFNSATHSGDGFFLWAGQQTLDSGQGGCNGNIIYKNDFSHAPANGIEVTFSSNFIVQNQLKDCRYGIWAGYSHHTTIKENIIGGNEFGIAFEHGNNNVINMNYLEKNQIGIQLWEREQQPADWGFAQKRNINSRNYQISNNIFFKNPLPLNINQTDSILIKANAFYKYDDLLTGASNTNLIREDNVERKNLTPVVPNTLEWQAIDSLAPLPDGMDTNLPEHQLSGRQYILMNQWGPYSFNYPSIWLREIQEDGTYVFLLLGPEGNWKAVDGAGFDQINPKSGSFPATLTAKRNRAAEQLRLDLSFIGSSFVTQFGDSILKGTPFPFSFERLEKGNNEPN